MLSEAPAVVRLAITKFRPKKSYKTLTGLIRDLTSDLYFGTKKAGEESAKPVVSEAFFLQARKQKFRWNVEQFDRHLAGKHTLYFVGQHRVRAPYTLAVIDIDCKKWGTLAGAIAFAKWIKENVIPGLVFETSTNGNGVHGYFVVSKEGTYPHLVNQGLKRLQAYLRQFVPNFQIENVEIKGHAPEPVYGDNKRIVALKFGQLIKMPRTLGLAEMLTCPVVQAYDLLRKELIPAKKQKPLAQGSIEFFTESDLNELPKLRSVAERILGDGQHDAGNRKKVTPDDMAIALLILKFCLVHPNENGAMPQKRAERLWKWLYEEGYVDRAWQAERWTYIFHLLTDRNCLDIESLEYWFIPETPGKGQACRWAIKASVLVLIVGNEGNSTSYLTRTTLNITLGLRATADWAKIRWEVGREGRWWAEVDGKLEKLWPMVA